MIAIINNKMGNIHSVKNALDVLQVEGKITNNKHEIINSKGIIFPGVGAFPVAMGNLKKSKLDKLLFDLVIKNHRPFLGICLGMQILFEKSFENVETDGLGFLKGKVVRINASHKNKVPHVGWSSFSQHNDSLLFKNIDINSDFYFDHSYYVKGVELDSIALLEYGQKMCVAVQDKNIFGVQFHPEKSQRTGLKLLRNFTNFVLGLK